MLKHVRKKRFPPLCLIAFGVLIVHSPVQALSDIFKAVDRGNTSVVRTYLNAHGGPNLVDDKGRSLLARAATRGYVEITEMLLGAGADFDQADPDGVTPLIHASAQGHVSIIERMIDSAKRQHKHLNYADKKG